MERASNSTTQVHSVNFDPHGLYSESILLTPSAHKFDFIVNILYNFGLMVLRYVLHSCADVLFIYSSITF